MIRLKQEDWAEIYYALDTKVLDLNQGAYGSEVEAGQDARWIGHMEALKRKLGPDGILAMRDGVGVPRMKD